MSYPTRSLSAVVCPFSAGDLVRLDPDDSTTFWSEDGTAVVQDDTCTVSLDQPHLRESVVVFFSPDNRFVHSLRIMRRGSSFCTVLHPSLLRLVMARISELVRA